MTEVAAKGVASHHSTPMSLGLENKDNRFPEEGAKGDWVDELSQVMDRRGQSIGKNAGHGYTGVS